MVRIKKETLIIEIPCSEPLDELAYMQEAICEVLSNIDYTKNNSTHLCSAVWQLSGLLRATIMSSDQSVAIMASWEKDKKTKEAYQ